MGRLFAVPIDVEYLMEEVEIKGCGGVSQARVWGRVWGRRCESVRLRASGCRYACASTENSCRWEGETVIHVRSGLTRRHSLALELGTRRHLAAEVAIELLPLRFV